MANNPLGPGGLPGADMAPMKNLMGQRGAQLIKAQMKAKKQRPASVLRK